MIVDAFRVNEVWEGNPSFRLGLVVDGLEEPGADFVVGGAAGLCGEAGFR